MEVGVYTYLKHYLHFYIGHFMGPLFMQRARVEKHMSQDAKRPGWRQCSLCVSFKILWYESFIFSMKLASGKEAVTLGESSLESAEALQLDTSRASPGVTRH